MWCAYPLPPLGLLFCLSRFRKFWTFWGWKIKRKRKTFRYPLYVIILHLNINDPTAHDRGLLHKIRSFLNFQTLPNSTAPVSQRPHNILNIRQWKSNAQHAKIQYILSSTSPVKLHSWNRVSKSKRTKLKI